MDMCSWLLSEPIDELVDPTLFVLVDRVTLVLAKPRTHATHYPTSTPLHHSVCSVSIDSDGRLIYMRCDNLVTMRERTRVRW